MYLSNFYSVEL